MAKEAQLNETPAEKRARKNAEREQAAAVARQREEDARRARMEVMPKVLFELMVRAKRLENAGLAIEVELLTKTEKQWGEPDYCGELAGVKFKFGTRSYRHGDEDYDNRQEHVLRLVSEEWEVSGVEERMKALQDEFDEKQRRKALAEEAKKLLTPEQLAALREFN
jgi:hypothetical protein